MNTRNAYKIRLQKATNRRNMPSNSLRVAADMAAAPAGMAVRLADSKTQPNEQETAQSVCGIGLASHDRIHPLTDGYTNARLAHCEDSVKGRFDLIEPVLKTIADLPNGERFTEQAQNIALRELGYELPQKVLDDAWIAGPNMKALYAHCAFTALKEASAKFVDDLNRQVEVVQDTRNFFLDCGYHAVDISPCSDGRLKGLTRYILRLPLSSFTRRKSHAGALFDVETDIQHWMETELRRHRESIPTSIDSNTRYLKVAVYHTSTSAPAHQGCAAHGSNEHKAMEAPLELLKQFHEGIENSFCCGNMTDILLIGVDTDNDSIRVHVPDSNGDLSPHRLVDNAELYKKTINMSEDDARLVVYDAIREASQQDGWGQGDGEPHEGMRRLVANLLINNLSQIEYVAEVYGSCYPDIGHAERFISVGDGFEEVQMRNVSYYAHLDTLEEGTADMDVGIKIFTGLNVKRGLPIPIAIHYRYDSRVPGSRDRAIVKARRVKNAIMERYEDLDHHEFLYCHLSVQDKPFGSSIETVEDGL